MRGTLAMVHTVKTKMNATQIPAMSKPFVLTLMAHTYVSVIKDTQEMEPTAIVSLKQKLFCNVLMPYNLFECNVNRESYFFCRPF